MSFCGRSLIEGVKERDVEDIRNQARMQKITKLGVLMNIIMVIT